MFLLDVIGKYTYSKKTFPPTRGCHSDPRRADSSRRRTTTREGRKGETQEECRHRPGTEGWTSIRSRPESLSGRHPTPVTGRHGRLGNRDCHRRAGRGSWEHVRRRAPRLRCLAARRHRSSSRSGAWHRGARRSAAPLAPRSTPRANLRSCRRGRRRRRHFRVPL